MAISHPSGSRVCLALAIAVCFLLQGCFSAGDQISLGFWERAGHCFDDHNVYKECATELRLSVEGAFHVVGEESVDEYCGGACFVETKMALQCVEAAVAGGESFRFSNGASVPAVKEALATGCSYTPQRGTFEIREREECGEYLHRPGEEGADDYYCSGAGSPEKLLMLFFYVVVIACCHHLNMQFFMISY